MELTKLNIHMNQIKKSITSQITLEDDFNVSDIKPDIDSLITDSSNLAIDSIKVLDGRILIKGKLEDWEKYKDNMLQSNINKDINWLIDSFSTMNKLNYCMERHISDYFYVCIE